MNARAIEHFADVNIAKACDDALVQQGRFDWCVAPFKAVKQIGLVEIIGKRLWPQILH